MPLLVLPPTSLLLAAGALSVGGLIFYKSRSGYVCPLGGRTFCGGAFSGPFRSIDLPLESIVQETHDTSRLVFTLPPGSKSTGLSLSSFVIATPTLKDGKRQIRPYTPISDLSDPTKIEFLIKNMPNGHVSSYMTSLKPGDKVPFRGGISSFSWKQNNFKSITLLGAGSGITPLYQLATGILKDDADSTKIKLVYGNKTPNDIPLKRELDQLKKDFPGRFEVEYFVNNDAEKVPNARQGQINASYLQNEIPGPSEDTCVFVSGPPPFVQSICGDKRGPFFQGNLTGHLKDIGYSKSQVYKF